MIRKYEHFNRWLIIIGHRSLTGNLGANWFGYLWSLVVFLWLICPLVLSIVQFAIERQQIMVASIFFYSIIPVQFALAVRYHRLTHFESVLRDCRLSGIKVPTQVKLLLGIILGLISCVIVLAVIWGVTGSVPHGFDWMIMTEGTRLIGGVHLQNFGYIILVGYWILGWGTLLTNLAVFMLVFSKHVKDIRGLLQYLENEVIWKLDQTSFTQITRQIIELRFVISQSINNLESFYTVTTILGAISLGPIIELKQINPYLIFNVLIYFLIQIFFIYYIFVISKNREDILKVIKSPSVMFKCLTNIKSMQNVQALREHFATDSINNMVDDHLNYCKIAAYSPVTAERVLDVETSASELELLTLSYKNNAGIDWMILQTVLSEKWASFNLLGVSFDDSEVIKKGIGMTSLIVVVSTYLNSLHLLVTG